MAVAHKGTLQAIDLNSLLGIQSLIQVIDKIRAIPTYRNVDFTLAGDTVHLWVSMDGDGEDHPNENVDRLYAIEYEFRQSGEPIRIETHVLGPGESFSARLTPGAARD